MSHPLILGFQGAWKCSLVLMTSSWGVGEQERALTGGGAAKRTFRHAMARRLGWRIYSSASLNFRKERRAA